MSTLGKEATFEKMSPKKPGMHLEVSSIGVNLAVISYALYLEDWHTGAIDAASNHTNKEQRRERINKE